MPKDYHVVPEGKGWKVKWSRGSSRHRKKSAAKRKARQLADSGDEVIIHRKDGTVQNSITAQ